MLSLPGVSPTGISPNNVSYDVYPTLNNDREDREEYIRVLEQTIDYLLKN